MEDNGLLQCYRHRKALTGNTQAHDGTSKVCHKEDIKRFVIVVVLLHAGLIVYINVQRVLKMNVDLLSSYELWSHFSG